MLSEKKLKELQTATDKMFVWFLSMYSLGRRYWPLC